ncbi:hypothetical protein BDF21DRAFT_406581 [Thamnidium elegans]|nr:hypothetical protein BDF21DRAFT_406581 [Thamnidium elegans]
MFILYFCICLLLAEGTLASFSLNKRQAIASRSCGEQNNTVSICSPTSSSVWDNGTFQEITWKYNNPKFGQYTRLDLYLLYKNSSNDEYVPIKNWTGLDKDSGIIVPEIDDSWYPTELAENSASITLNVYMYIVGAGYDIYTDLDLIPTDHNFFPAPQPFTLIQNSRNTTTTTTSSSSPSSTNSISPLDAKSDNEEDKSLPGWAIAVIVIAIVLFILALIALVWAYRRYKNKKQLNNGASNNMGIHGDDEKIPVLTPNKNESNIVIPAASATTATKGDIASINSSTQQLWSPRSLSPRHDEISFITTSEKPAQHQQLGLHSEANQSSSILSSTDALMIADTFRQFMRKPDWNEELELNEQNKKALQPTP